MNTIQVNCKLLNSQILIGESLGHLQNYTEGRNLYLITDHNLYKFYKDKFPEVPIFAIEPGEGSKKLENTIAIYRWLLQNQADRSSFIVGIGGGVVCDLTGFVASTFMRGVDFGFVATTLLAQVDASVGGKNGVDLDGYKNIVGTFNQPRFVICDVSMLKTLPTEEFSNGMAEVVKHALIADRNMFDFIEKNKQGIFALNSQMVEYLVTRSVQIKAKIVEEDEHEVGIRRVLNLGHTWGHAVEKITGLPHGQAVSVGLAFSANLSVKKGLMSVVEKKRLLDLLSNLGLPIKVEVDPIGVFEVLKKDKKRENEFVHFVLMKGIGDVDIQKISLNDLAKVIK